MSHTLRKSAALLVCILGVAAASGVNAKQLTAAEKQKIVASMDLKDPGSAQFRWLPDDPTQVQYCGWVNAKNGFGGYVGFKQFLALVERDARGTITNSVTAMIMEPEFANASGCRKS